MPTQVITTVPTTAITGKISITTTDGTGVSATDFIVIKPPTITSFTPLSGSIGTQVTISGTNLSSVTEVRFNGVSSTGIIPVSANSIKAIVPLGATTGRISVTNAAGTTMSVSDFKVLPKINSITPLSGPLGTELTITGTNFAGVTLVKFGVVSVPFTIDSATQIRTTVPTTLPPSLNVVITFTAPEGVAIGPPMNILADAYEVVAP